MENTSFLEDYLHFTDGNESPIAFHKWAALSALSVAAGRRFWFRLGHIVYYPHLYVLFVGEPGVKKSTAMDAAKDIVREANICPLAASQTTREAIGKMMSHEKYKGKKFFKTGDETVEYNQLAIFATEFTQFIAVNPEGMLEFFTAVYGEKIHSTEYKNAGSDYVIGPYITLLGCLTPHMLKGYLKMNVLTGGFARRTVFVYGFEGAIVPIPRYLPSQGEARDRCVTYLQNLQHHSGEFKFGPGAQEWYEEWYTNTRKNLKDISTPRTEAYYRTKHELLFKTAMLLSLGEDPQAREILPEHFILAEERYFKPHVDKNLERVFEGTGLNPNAGVSVQICNMIESLGQPISEKKVMALFGDQATDYRALQDTLDHLCLVGRLERRKLSLPNGTLLGVVIGTPDCLAKYSAEQLAGFLTLPAPRPESNTDSSQT